MSPVEKTRRSEMALCRAVCFLFEVGLLALVISFASNGHDIIGGLFGIAVILVSWLDGNFQAFMEAESRTETKTTKETTSAA